MRLLTEIGTVMLASREQQFGVEVDNDQRLDRRVAVKRYGPLVLEGLPAAERVIGTWAQVRTRCEDFFAQFGIGAEV